MLRVLGLIILLTSLTGCMTSEAQPPLGQAKMKSSQANPIVLGSGY